eukprot:1155362-Pelagomonas_calceolata.AAC.1
MYVQEQTSVVLEQINLGSICRKKSLIRQGCSSRVACFSPLPQAVDQLPRTLASLILLQVYKGYKGGWPKARDSG